MPERFRLCCRTPSAWLIVLGAVGSLVVAPRVWPFWLWAVACALFLLWQKPLFEHHLVLLAAALAVPAGTSLEAAAVRAPYALAVSAVLNLWNLAQNGYGNTYYSVAVQSMLQSWKNFY